MAVLNGTAGGAASLPRYHFSLATARKLGRQPDALYVKKADLVSFLRSLHLHYATSYVTRYFPPRRR